MNIIQLRYKFGENFTLSRIAIDGEWPSNCPYILEDKVREIAGMPVEKWKMPCETAIPEGRYKVIIDLSQRFGKKMLHVLDVPGFEGIRIHAGNTNHDTDGCLLCGKERNEKTGEVSGSRIALEYLFNRIEKALNKGEQVWWEIRSEKT